MVKVQHTGVMVRCKWKRHKYKGPHMCDRPLQMSPGGHSQRGAQDVQRWAKDVSQETPHKEERKIGGGLRGGAHPDAATGTARQE